MLFLDFLILDWCIDLSYAKPCCWVAYVISIFCHLCYDKYIAISSGIKEYDTNFFSGRLIQSLATCQTCIIMNDQLQVVPHSSHVAEIKPCGVKKANAPLTENRKFCHSMTVLKVYFSIPNLSDMILKINLSILSFSVIFPILDS